MHIRINYNFAYVDNFFRKSLPRTEKRRKEFSQLKTYDTYHFNIMMIMLILKRITKTKYLFSKYKPSYDDNK